MLNQLNQLSESQWKRLFGKLRKVAPGTHRPSHVASFLKNQSKETNTMVNTYKKDKYKQVIRKMVERNTQPKQALKWYQKLKKRFGKWNSKKTRRWHKINTYVERKLKKKTPINPVGDDKGINGAQVMSQVLQPIVPSPIRNNQNISEPNSQVNISLNNFLGDLFNESKSNGTLNLSIQLQSQTNKKFPLLNGHKISKNETSVLVGSKPTPNTPTAKNASPKITISNENKRKTSLLHPNPLPTSSGHLPSELNTTTPIESLDFKNKSSTESEAKQKFNRKFSPQKRNNDLKKEASAPLTSKPTSNTPRAKSASPRITLPSTNKRKISLLHPNQLSNSSPMMTSGHIFSEFNTAISNARTTPPNESLKSDKKSNTPVHHSPKKSFDESNSNRKSKFMKQLQSRNAQGNNVRTTTVASSQRKAQNTTKLRNHPGRFHVPNTQYQTQIQLKKILFETPMTPTWQEWDKREIQTPVFTKLNQNHVHDITLPYEIRLLICDNNVSVYEINKHESNERSVDTATVDCCFSFLFNTLSDIKQANKNLSWDEIISDIEKHIVNEKDVQKAITILQIQIETPNRYFVYVTNNNYTAKHTFMMFSTLEYFNTETNAIVNRTYDETLIPGGVHLFASTLMMYLATLGDWESFHMKGAVYRYTHMRCAEVNYPHLLTARTNHATQTQKSSRIEFNIELGDLPVSQMQYFWWLFVMGAYSKWWEKPRAGIQSFFKKYVPNAKATELIMRLTNIMKSLENVPIYFFIGLPGQPVENKYFQSYDLFKGSNIILGTKKPGIMCGGKIIQKARVILGTMKECRQLYPDFCFPETLQV